MNHESYTITSVDFWQDDDDDDDDAWLRVARCMLHVVVMLLVCALRLGFCLCFRFCFSAAKVKRILWQIRDS